MIDLAKQLKQEAELLEAKARILRDAATLVNGNGNGNGSHEAVLTQVPVMEYPGTRTEQLTQFLASRGGATRNEIERLAGMPRGTVAGLLGKGKKFKVDPRGLWHPARNMAERSAA